MPQHDHSTAIINRIGAIIYLKWFQSPALQYVPKVYDSQFISFQKPAHLDCRKLKMTA